MQQKKKTDYEYSLISSVFFTIQRYTLKSAKKIKYIAKHKSYTFMGIAKIKFLTPHQADYLGSRKVILPLVKKQTYYYSPTS